MHHVVIDFVYQDAEHSSSTDCFPFRLIHDLLVESSWNAMFVNVPTLALFRALATKIASTVSVSSGRTTSEVNHFSLNGLESLSLFLRVHHIFGGKVRIQVSRAATERRLPITATLPISEAYLRKPCKPLASKFSCIKIEGFEQGDRLSPLPGHCRR